MAAVNHCGQSLPPQMLCRSSVTAIKHLDKVTVCLWSRTKTRHKSFSKKKKRRNIWGKLLNHSV